MKKLLIVLGTIFVLLFGVYFWLMSEAGPENADGTEVSVTLPLDAGS